MDQEYKVVNLSNKSECFFYAHSFKSAYRWALDYITRNKNDTCILYRVNNRIGERWLRVEY